MKGDGWKERSGEETIGEVVIHQFDWMKSNWNLIFNEVMLRSQNNEQIYEHWRWGGVFHLRETVLEKSWDKSLRSISNTMLDFCNCISIMKEK